MSIQIYGLAHPTTQRVRYVGKSINATTARLNNHMYKARSGRNNTAFGVWLRGLQDRGLRPKIVIFECVVNRRWQTAERAWIALLRASGHRLFNKHPGGNGAHTRAKLPVYVLPLLGKVADRRIAEMVGLSRETVCYHRRRAGIAASHDQSQTRPPPGRARLAIPDRIRNRLGKVSDHTLAFEWGVSRHTVTSRRKELGIPGRKGGLKHGSQHHNAKLTPKAVAYIRKYYRRYCRRYGFRALARKFNVHTTTILAVVERETWK